MSFLYEVLAPNTYIPDTPHNVTTLRIITCNRRNHCSYIAAALASATFGASMVTSPCFPTSSVAVRSISWPLAWYAWIRKITTCLLRVAKQAGYRYAERASYAPAASNAIFFDVHRNLPIPCAWVLSSKGIARINVRACFSRI